MKRRVRKGLLAGNMLSGSGSKGKKRVKNFRYKGDSLAYYDDNLRISVILKPVTQDMDGSTEYRRYIRPRGKGKFSGPHDLDPLDISIIEVYQKHQRKKYPVH